MKPNHIKNAKRFIRKRWYYSFRAWWFKHLYLYWDKVLLESRESTIVCLTHMERYARKYEYYNKKEHENT